MTIGTVDLPFFTGFEMGSDDLVNAGQGSLYDVEDSTVKTGNYSAQLGDIKWELATTRSDIYMAAWVRNGIDSTAKIAVELADEKVVRILYNRTSKIVYAQVDGSTVATGTVDVDTDTWFHVEVYFSIANAGGQIKTWIDGLADIDYSGDTQPDASGQIKYINIGNLINVSVYMDDFHAATSRIYDRRVQGAVPTSDDTAQLTASGGGSNYEDVDEIPPDGDTTYVSTDVDAQKDLYGHGGFDLSNYITPFYVGVWARARKTVANTDQMRLLIESNGTEDQGDWEDLLTSWAGYMQKVWVNDPDTAAAWADEAAIDAALIGIESNIP